MNRLSHSMLICLMICVSASTAYGQYIVNFSVQYGTTDTDVGSSLTLTDLGGNPLLVITPRSQVDSSSPTDPDATANVDPAHLIWDGDADIYSNGLGVQPGIGTGSTGINGSGIYQDEDITFAYANGGVSLDSISLTLNGLNTADDDPIIWITTTAGRFVINEAAIFAAATSNGSTGSAADSWEIVFDNFAGIVGGAQEVVTSFTLREPTGEIWIKETEFGFAVPEPSTTTLIALSGIMLLARRKKP